MEVVDYRKRARKLPMKKREDNASRMCTFTKRRGGLFKKATDLHLPTGAHIAVVVFSEAGRPYFHGSTEAIDRFLAQENNNNNQGVDVGVDVDVDGVEEEWIQGLIDPNPNAQIAGEEGFGM